MATVRTSYGLGDLLREGLPPARLEGACLCIAPVSGPRVLGGLGPVGCVTRRLPAPACDTRAPPAPRRQALVPASHPTPSPGPRALLTLHLGWGHAKLGTPKPRPPGCRDAASKPQEPTPGVLAGGGRGTAWPLVPPHRHTHGHLRHGHLRQP